MARFDVTWLGKLATGLLLGAVPAFVCGSSDFPFHELFTAIGWIVGLPGLVLSWYTAVRYLPQIRRSVAIGQAQRAAGPR
jgi:cardiolipin synthase